MDLTSILKQSGAIGAIAQQLGVNEQMAEIGAAALLPSILGGFKKTAQAQPSGLDGLGGLLGQLGGVEDHISISIDGERIVAVSEADLDRTKSDGKTSSVHFLHFPFTSDQVAALRNPVTEVMVRIDHPNYGHAALVLGPIRDELGGDFV